MGKKISGLIIMLVIFCGILAASQAAYAMTKTLRPTTFGCEAKSVTVQENAGKLNIQWQYDLGLEGTKVTINLYKNNKFLQTVAENVAIGKNGRGSWDWGNRAGADKLDETDTKVYQIEIVSLTDSKLRVKGENFSIRGVPFQPTGDRK